MKKKIFFILFLPFLFLISCNSTKNVTESNNNFKKTNDFKNPDQSIDLVEHLRRVAGVQVNGSGANASITIRGINSINASSEPLFVVNGQPLTGGLNATRQLVPIQEIKSIRVLKNPSDTGFYGVRGANGVIEITLK